MMILKIQYALTMCLMFGLLILTACSKSDADLLAGAWYSAGGPVAGLEFLNDGKVMVTHVSQNYLKLGETVTWDYEVLDGGRIRFTRPDGGTDIFLMEISTKTLRLMHEQSPQQPIEFKRLDKITIAEAHRDEIKRRTERHEKMVESVQEFLRKPGLVEILKNPELKLGRHALVPGKEPGQTGIAYVESMGIMPVQYEIQIDVQTTSPMQPISVHITYGNIIGPVGEESEMQPKTEVFTATGEPDSIELVGNMRKVVVDKAVHDTLVKQYEKFQSERMTKLNLLADSLKAKAVLSGQKADEAGSISIPVTLTLERMRDSLEFEAAVKMNDKPQSHRAKALVTYWDGHAALVIRISTGMITEEIWSVNPVGEVKFEGKWKEWRHGISSGTSPSRQGILNLEIVQSHTKEDVTAQNEAINHYINHELQSAKDFIGFTAGRIGNADGHWPFRLQMQADQDGAITGRVWWIAFGSSMELAGKYDDGQIKLSVTNVLNEVAEIRIPQDKHLGESLKQQLWYIDLVPATPVPVLEGKISLSGNESLFRLTRLESETLPNLRTKAISQLKNRYFNIQSNTIRSQEISTFMRFDSDASGQLSGEMLGKNLPSYNSSPALIKGELREYQGYLLADIDISTAASGPQNRAPNPSRALLIMRLEDDQLFLHGPITDFEATRIIDYVSLSPATEEVQVSDNQRTQLAVLRAGALSELPRDAKPGDQVVLYVRGQRRGKPIYFGDERYRATNLQTAAVHAGLIQDGELALLRVTYESPHNKDYPAVERNGVQSRPISARNRETQRLLTVKLEKIEIQE